MVWQGAALAISPPPIPAKGDKFHSLYHLLPQKQPGNARGQGGFGCEVRLGEQPRRCLHLNLKGFKRAILGVLRFQNGTLWKEPRCFLTFFHFRRDVLPTETDELHN